jgi:hypothetical protein
MPFAAQRSAFSTDIVENAVGKSEVERHNSYFI